MSDTTPLALVIHRVDLEDEAEVTRIIEQVYGLAREWATQDELEITGDPWTDFEARTGTAQQITEDLRGKRVWFTVWEDPHYEWLGDLYVHSPDLGVWTAKCDANGNPVYYADEVQTMMRDHERAEEMLGLAWGREIADMEKP